MIKRFFVMLVLLGIVATFWFLFDGYVANTELNTTAQYYAENTANEVGAANVVTAIIVTYRGLDTLGEVTVLFLTAAIVGVLLSINKTSKSVPKAATDNELLQTSSNLLTPLIFLFGAYIFIYGHLTPGGGFQGGAIVASGILLILLTNPARHLSHRIIGLIESASGLIFVSFGVFGLVLAGGFLDNKVLPLGELGELFSAGAIPIIYSFVGLKVGAEFSSMLTDLSEVEEE